MKKILGFVVAVLSLVVVMASISFATEMKDTKMGMSGSNSGKNTSQSKKVVPAKRNIKVAIKNFDFSPKVVFLRKGDSITWTNFDDVAHTATSINGKTFNSGMLPKGKSYTFTFTKSGTYNYKCLPHPIKMKGVVHVK